MSVEMSEKFDATFMWGVAEAVKKLRPHSLFTLHNRDFVYWEDSDGLPAPKWEEVQAVLDADQKIYESLQYSRDRASEYRNPIIQLDELWHLINSGTIIDQDSVWFKEIKSIKDKYPKS